MSVLSKMWDSSASPDATGSATLPMGAQNSGNSSYTLSLVGSQFQYMDFYPENLGSYFHFEAAHRKLNETASDFYT